MTERRYDHAATDGEPAEAEVTTGEAQRAGSADEVGGALLPSGALLCECGHFAEQHSPFDPHGCAECGCGGYITPSQRREDSLAASSGANVVDATARFQCAREGHVPTLRMTSIFVESWVCKCERCGVMAEFKNREVIRVG